MDELQIHVSTWTDLKNVTLNKQNEVTRRYVQYDFEYKYETGKL